MKTADICLTEKADAGQAERRQHIVAAFKNVVALKAKGQIGSEKLVLPDVCIGQDDCIVATAEVIAAMADDVLTPLAASPARHRLKGVPDALPLVFGSSENSLPGDERIIGSGDRAQHLAMIAITVTPPLRPALVQRTRSLPSLRPSSRAECGRRCGADGFCDPSSKFGCGGEYCIQLHESLY